MESETLYLRISPGSFHILKFIIEGYDGLALLSSYDMKRGLVYLRYSQDVRPEVYELIASLAKRLSPFPVEISKQL